MIEIILLAPVKLGPGTRALVERAQADELVGLGVAEAAPHQDTGATSTPAPAAVSNVGTAAGTAAGGEQGGHHEGEGETVEDTSAPPEKAKSKAGKGSR
ncbi:hypothetical protein [Zavarzinia compransoris]|uniref:Uncharacterized protein n=1 Tax=Zavarzinia compransoris TaxID=1264899 RepID=A0A317E8Y2_9PROT|nr:hypothetical protein [Zavarzinia compransoris]PWR23359.1 hypothetical protein DKG75_01975 [Zavarzinia compransoris]TDP46067.1 hypothetical protein DES42_104148 [Zavarzinia compransoris]